MPRKTWTKAQHETTEANFNRWRLLVRNPDFLRDLDHLKALHSEQRRAWYKEGEDTWMAAFQRYQDEVKRVADKWTVVRIPPGAIVTLDDRPQNLERWGRSDWQGPPYSIDYPPVVLSELKEDRFLYMWVDVTKPIDLALACIEAELRPFYKTRPAKRGRPHSLDFQLMVFDLVELEGKAFTTVARRLHMPVSTIRDAYLSACYKIGIASRSHDKTRVPAVDPGPFSECPDPKCRAAKEEKDWCLAHRACIDQDQITSTRERVGLDLSALEALQARPKGRIDPKPRS